MSPIPFHLAFPVHDLAAARAFYVGVLGCGEGRSSDRWIDFDFHGHQIVAHLCPAETRCGATSTTSTTSDVDGKAVPVRHFGAVLAWDDFFALEKNLREARVPFRIEPHTRFEGEPGEQATMFLTDPSGNAIEFKAFRDPAALFRK